ncbi:MAG: hypothetical protein LC130_08885 [Bryobacterales bacterium]|nr:hypothetical protein [Bryobacterales bacterium]
MSYISSNANRFYAAPETGYGQISAITGANRLPAVKLTTRQELVRAERKDKSGTRTFPGTPPGSRRQTSFELTTYMTGWSTPPDEPGYGPLFRATLGSAPILFSGGTASAGSTASQIAFTSAHRLAAGQAVSYAGELRFVSTVVDARTVQLNAPLSLSPGTGAPIGPTLTYFPATELQSASIFDYWSPSTAVQRILCGAAVDRMRIEVNGDFHQFTFSGMAQDLVDSCSFQAGMGQLGGFPAEPPLASFDYSIIPGHLGQAWLGNTPDRFYTITSASFILDNDLDLRAKEFGSPLPRCISPGRRTVSIDFDLFERDDDACRTLYQAARQQSPIGVMFQLGEQQGQLLGVYLQSVVPEVPSFDDSDARLQWRFRNSIAQGTVDDEISIAFG